MRFYLPSTYYTELTEEDDFGKKKKGTYRSKSVLYKNIWCEDFFKKRILLLFILLSLQNASLYFKLVPRRAFGRFFIHQTSLISSLILHLQHVILLAVARSGFGECEIPSFSYIHWWQGGERCCTHIMFTYICISQLDVNIVIC